MALRLANQINRQFVKNVCRSLSGKRDVSEVESVVQKAEETNAPADTPAPPSPTITSMSTTQYEVCRPRTTPISPYPHVLQNETDAVKNTLAMQHLQPAMLPEYYKPPVEINAPCMYLDPVSETEKQTVGKQRKFEESKTCKNVTLPLRAPKLASPFPEPVKVVLHSNVVSDQEKAQQMLAEARLMKQTTQHSMQQKMHPSIRSMPPTRNYSTTAAGGGKKKCKIMEQAGHGNKCPKKTLPGCKPVSKNISCTKKKGTRPPCLPRKYPPYPSYSESCHEDPIDKPSECKICPYKLSEHPTFKPPKQSLHTVSAYFLKNKGECKKPTRKSKETPCQIAQRKKKEGKQKDNTKPKKKAIANVESATEANAVQDLSWGCTKPKMYGAFLPSEEEANKEQKKAKKNPATTTTLQAKRIPSISLDKEMTGWLDNLQTESILQQLSSNPLIKATDDGRKAKIPKFPFKESTFEIVKQRKPRPKVVIGCPKKPRPKLIKDCPPVIEEDDCKQRRLIGDNLGLLLQGKSEDDPKGKCKKPDLHTCLDPVDDPRIDRCRKPKAGKTLICPDDLLSKKPKKKKKTCPIVPLNRISLSTHSNPTINP